MPEQENVGTALAADLVKAICDANRNAELSRDVLIELRDILIDEVKLRQATLETLDEIAGRLETFSGAANILADVVSGNGKKKLTVEDFVHALTSAEQDVFGDDDGAAEEDDEEGDLDRR